MTSDEEQREGSMDKPVFVYVTYIVSTPEKVWRALVEPEVTVEYWRFVNVSDWRPGSRWEHREGGPQGELRLVGKVLESVPPRRTERASVLRGRRHADVTQHLPLRADAPAGAGGGVLRL
jgi:hypothetical protein